MSASKFIEFINILRQQFNSADPEKDKCIIGSIEYLFCKPAAIGAFLLLDPNSRKVIISNDPNDKFSRTIVKSIIKCDFAKEPTKVVDINNFTEIIQQLLPQKMYDEWYGPVAGMCSVAPFLLPHIIELTTDYKVPFANFYLWFCTEAGIQYPDGLLDQINIGKTFII
jgi:hypothetical protein